VSAALTLCYHAVSETWERSLALPEARLVRQVRMVRALGYRPCDAQAVVSGRGRRFHVTFDDAFAGISRTLIRLHELGIPHSVFVCTSLASAGGAPLRIPELEAEPIDELRTMSWADVGHLAELGTQFFSHTVSHPHLPELSDHELGKELRGAKQQLEDALSRPCPYLAYPFGEHDARVRLAAERAGYAAAFALGRSGLSTDRFAIPRVGIYHRDNLLRAFMKTTPLAHRRFYSGGASRTKSANNDA
jgi:peptidoglycan/xylan/chitin deacetylase (PgdA/CDA1 family)